MATLTMSLLDDMRNARSQIGEWAKGQKETIDHMEAEHEGMKTEREASARPRPKVGAARSSSGSSSSTGAGYFSAHFPTLQEKEKKGRVKKESGWGHPTSAEHDVDLVSNENGGGDKGTVSEEEKTHFGLFADRN